VQTAYKGPIAHDPDGGRSQETLGYRVIDCVCSTARRRAETI